MDKKGENILFVNNKMKKKKNKLKFFQNKTKYLQTLLQPIYIIIIFILIIIISLLYHNKIKKNINKINKEKESKANKGFLKINTLHKLKYTHYNYSSNIIIYKDLYDNITYVPITDTNTILESKQLSKEEFSKICEEGILLDKIKYKRNKNPKISVVIPYYNKNLFSINMPLRSIQNQSLKDIEIIFVDDGSSEEKIKDVLDAMKDDNRIILLRHKESKTTLMTRVDGIRYALGEYIIQLDQDDMYLNNLLFEKLYNKAKELDVDIIQFIYFSNNNPNIFQREYEGIQKSVIITQPELKTAFLSRYGLNTLGNCNTRVIWNKFVRRTTYLEAIEDLGDEYLNHKFRLYEDTIMMFELSQVANSYYYYNIEGYRYCSFNCSKTADKNITIELETFAMNQLLFIKLLLFKIDPKFDRYHIYRELGFGKCDNDVKYLNRNEFDLGLEVIEAIFELERIYNNTNPQLLECAKKILKHYEI